MRQSASRPRARAACCSGYPLCPPRRASRWARCRISAPVSARHSTTSGVQMSSHTGTPMRTPADNDAGPARGRLRRRAFRRTRRNWAGRACGRWPRTLPGIEQQHGIVEPDPSSPQGAPISDRRGRHRRCRGQGLDRVAASACKARLEHQIFGRIAADEEFGEEDQIGARPADVARAARARARLPAMSPITG